VNDLDPLRIEAELARLGAALGRPVTVAAVTASTNDDARRAAAEGAPHGATFLADAQTRGRGRSGHGWHSPPGENLYLSMVLRPRIEPRALPPLALVIGLAAARVVEEALEASAVCEASAGIKWPNDVFVGGQKIAGILVESALRGGTIDAVIAGIGLNVGASSFPEELGGRATSLHLLGARALDRSTLAARLVVAIERMMRSFEAEGLAPFVSELGQRDALRGVPLEVGDVRGEGAGIDAEGYLCVRGEDGETSRVGSGSVTTHGPLGRTTAGAGGARGTGG
jgi:BirA family transcriptional regulator, biotin operon repressor / biotin---[acetyl-CoA-carboxylase] ligase